MDFFKIDYASLEFLQRAESKEAIEDLFAACCRNHNEISQVDPYNLTPKLGKLFQSFELSNQEAYTVRPVRLMIACSSFTR